MFTKESLYGYTRLSLLSEKPPADIEDIIQYRLLYLDVGGV